MIHIVKPKLGVRLVASPDPRRTVVTLREWLADARAWKAAQAAQKDKTA